MSGDRALDEQVHVEVMGNVLGRRFHTAEDWEVARGMTRRDDFQRCRRCRTERKKLSKTHWDDNTLCVPSVPKYSTDIAAAWTVVQAMKAQDRYHGFCWAVHQEIGYDEQVPEDLGWLLLARDASEVARLICCGALRAIAEPSVLDLGGACRMNEALAAVRGDEEVAS